MIHQSFDGKKPDGLFGGAAPHREGRKDEVYVYVEGEP